MLSPEILLSAGYKNFHDRMSADKLGEWYRASYQKRVSDETGTRYFITIRHGVMPAMSGQPSREFFTPENQFAKGGTTFNIEMLHHDESLEQVEAFFAEMWATLRLDYYEGGPDEARMHPQRTAA